ncbi:hypothetical protein KDA08_03670 [Candidatus Saccharibacteria bacterium]|nr:hypothetical protein [Candidatus Saccharibacteria bacterium]
MEVEKTEKSKKLVAVIGENGKGFFIRSMEYPATKSAFIDSLGRVSTTNADALESLLKTNHLRTPVYEGDEITLRF